MQNLENKRLTSNYHHYGVAPSVWNCLRVLLLFSTFLFFCLSSMSFFSPTIFTPPPPPLTRLSFCACSEWCFFLFRHICFIYPPSPCSLSCCLPMERHFHQQRRGRQGLHFFCREWGRGVRVALLFSTDSTFNPHNFDSFGCSLITPQTSSIPSLPRNGTPKSPSLSLRSITTSSTPRTLSKSASSSPTASSDTWEGWTHGVMWALLVLFLIWFAYVFILCSTGSPKWPQVPLQGYGKGCFNLQLPRLAFRGGWVLLFEL